MALPNALRRPVTDDDDAPDPIYGYVPPPPEPAVEPRRRGRLPGTKNKPRPAPVDTFDADALKSETVSEPYPSPEACPGCGKETLPVGLPVVRELVNAARDHLDGASPELKAHLAESSVLQLAARLDGFCSLVCWRDHQS
jgi:hypothetical protein